MPETISASDLMAGLNQPSAPAPSITSVGPDQSQADFEKSVSQNPVAPAKSIPVGAWELSSPDESPYQALHRLEPAVLGHIDGITPEQQQQAQNEWMDAYAKDVTDNGPMARSERFIKSISPSKVGSAAGKLAMGAWDELGNVAAHPIKSFPGLVLGTGKGALSTAEGIGQLGAGGLEQLAAAWAHGDNENNNPNNGVIPSDARLAAGIALARLKVEDQFQKLIDTGPTKPGEGLGNVVGSVGALGAAAPGEISGATEAGANAIKKTGTSLANVAKDTASGVANLSAKVSEYIPGIAPKAKLANAVLKAMQTTENSSSGVRAAISSLMEDAAAVKSAALQRTQMAEESLADAQAAQKTPQELAPLLKEVADAHRDMALYNAGSAFLERASSAASKVPQAASTTSRFISGATKTAAATGGGALAGLGYQGLTAAPGDENAASEGLVGGGALGMLADGALRSIRGLKNIGSAYFRAIDRVQPELPKTLPEDKPTLVPHDRIDELTKEEIQKPSDPPVTPEPTKPVEAPKPSEPLKTVEENKPLTPAKPEPISASLPKDEPPPAQIPAAQDIRKVAASSVPVAETPVPAGETERSTKLPGQHTTISQIGTSSPKQFGAKEMEIPAERRPQNPEGYYLMAGKSTPVTSTNIASVGYDPDTQLLGVNFKDPKNPGGRYLIHENVPPEVHQQLMAADSKGTFYRQNIKGNPNYRYINVDTPLHDQTGNPLPQVKAAATEVEKHQMRISSLRSSAERGYETPEEINRRIGAETAEHQQRMRGILSTVGPANQ